MNDAPGQEGRRQDLSPVSEVFSDDTDEERFHDWSYDQLSQLVTRCQVKNRPYSEKAKVMLKKELRVRRVTSSMIKSQRIAKPVIKRPGQEARGSRDDDRNGAASVQSPLPPDYGHPVTTPSPAPLSPSVVKAPSPASASTAPLSVAQIPVKAPSPATVSPAPLSPTPVSPTPRVTDLEGTSRSKSPSINSWSGWCQCCRSTASGSR